MKNGILVFLIGFLIACAIVIVKEKRAAAAHANEETRTAAVVNTPAGDPEAEEAQAEEEIPVEDTTPHLAFKGVPITGSLKNYVARMESAGFRCITTEPRHAILYGDFAGYADCTVQVSTLQALNVVSTISVEFPDRNKWPSLSSNYTRIKSLLTKKYGAPASCVERFGGYSATNDSDKMIHVQLDQCKYITTFLTPLGVIQLSIATGFSAHVKLVYQDKANSKLVDRQAYDDL